MTDEEWSNVRQTLLSAFPDIMTKLSFVGGQEQITATTRMWRKTLEPFTAEECFKVIGQWVKGEREPFKSNEWDRVALIMRSRIQFERDEVRKQNSPAKKILKLTRNDAGFGSMAAIFEAIDAKRNGEISEEQLEALTQKALDQIAPTDPLSGPRYDCKLCCDRGTVRVFREASLNEVKRDRFYAGVIGDMDMAACSCSAGDAYANAQRPYPRFSDSRFCVVKGVTHNQQLAAILEWLNSFSRNEWVA